MPPEGPHQEQEEPYREPWEELGAELLVDAPGVRCWIETVPPGESRPPHTHRHPWVSVVLSGASGESYDGEGRLIGTGEIRTGAVHYNGPERLPFRHHTRNTTEDRTLVMVAVEIRAEP